MRVDSDRLWRSLAELGEVGAYDDEATGLRGVCRLALTDADAAGRRLVRRWFEEVGLAVRVDRIGNTYGRRAGSDADAGVVMSGSHIDSVPTGGRFDGALGVLGALEVVRTLADAGTVTRRPIEIAFFTDEEGARFGTDMLGSATACGRLSVEQAWALRDRDGSTVRGELERIGFLGEAPERLTPPHAYVELHIEQGPILEAAGMDAGIVTGVQAISWFELTIVGRAAHAGTTPMELRRDAGLAAARINVRMHEMAASGRYGSGMRVTMGRIDASPNRVNIVPRNVVCTVDLRNPDDDAMAAAESDLERYYRELERDMPGIRIEARQTARTASVRFAPAVQSVIEARMQAHGVRYQRILSGAGHDAQELAAICPAGMIFVPGKHDGISHNPREFSTQEACALGTQLLLETLLDLSR
ncbi:MAG TPA: M20 family metallo-hydrolase [Polyangiaceae bacterium]|nr:M20 family metallo-hydrolase [Polyangiaceae bacterium]